MSAFRSLIALLPIVLLTVGLSSSEPSATAAAGNDVALSAGGRFQHSGNPAHNGGQICTRCHSGGTKPTVALSGPTLVQAGSTYRFQFEVMSNNVGVQDHSGLGVSVTEGTLAAADGETQIDGDADEITHTSPKVNDGAGKAVFDFDWTAPASGTSVTMYAAGNSVNRNFSNSGDNADKDQMAITVEDCLVSWHPFGTGTAGSGGFVPSLDGTDAPCTGGATLDIEDGLGGAPAFLWITAKEGCIDFVGGKLYLDPSIVFIRINLKLGGSKDVPGDGGLSLPTGDLSNAAGFSFFLQTLVRDPNAIKGISLSNAVRLDIGV